MLLHCGGFVGDALLQELLELHDGGRGDGGLLLYGYILGGGGLRHLLLRTDTAGVFPLLACGLPRLGGGWEVGGGGRLEQLQQADQCCWANLLHFVLGWWCRWPCLKPPAPDFAYHVELSKVISSQYSSDYLKKI